EAGLVLVERLAAYPEYVRGAGAWLDPALGRQVKALSDSLGYAREDTWSPGMAVAPPVAAGRPSSARSRLSDPTLDALLAGAEAGARLAEGEIVRLFSVRGGDVDAVGAAADALRRRASGEIVRYVVNRNINYTNVCTYGCKFCAFSKGK